MFGIFIEKNGIEEGDRAKAYEKSKGFIYLDALLEKLQYYELNREQYPTFAEFYPELILGFAKELGI